MRNDPVTGKPLILYERGRCYRCGTPARGLRPTEAKWPPWPVVCGRQNISGGTALKCKVNIPTVQDESMYISAQAAANTRGGPSNLPKYRFANVNWNQMSDRAVPGIQTVHVPRQQTRHRPGGNGQTGRGVDVKHGSYQRYLNRKKGNLKIELFHDTPSFYSKGCPCQKGDAYFSKRPYGSDESS